MGSLRHDSIIRFLRQIRKRREDHPAIRSPLPALVAERMDPGDRFDPSLRGGGFERWPGPTSGGLRRRVPGPDVSQDTGSIPIDRFDGERIGMRGPDPERRQGEYREVGQVER